jgi:Domain of unknown function (DUF4234)
MADDAAHIPAGPSSDISTDAQMAGGVTADVIAESPRTSSPSDDVEVTGSQATKSAQRRSRKLVAVGSGGSPDPASPRFGEASSTASRWSGPLINVVDDTPQWSFPGVPETPSAPDAPPTAGPAVGNQSELPFAAAAAPALAPPRPMPMFGPVGRTRSALLVPTLSVVTLGVYALAWHHTINRELEEFDPKLHSRPRRSTVAVLVPWLAGLLVSVAGAVLVIASRLGVHLPFNLHVATSQAYYMLAGLAAVPYLVLLLPFSVVAVVMTLERLRSVEEHAGATTDRQVRPVGTSLLLAIPVVGGLALLALEQRRLNAIWQAVRSSGHLYS